MVLMVIALGVTMAFTPAAHASPYKWCAYYGGPDGGGGTNCGFVTIKQCMDTIHGIGGTCGPNPFYTEPETSHRHKRAHKDD
jgi:Protein of unknown function (DUF3551)